MRLDLINSLFLISLFSDGLVYGQQLSNSQGLQSSINPSFTTNPAQTQDLSVALSEQPSLGLQSSAAVVSRISSTNCLNPSSVIVTVTVTVTASCAETTVSQAPTTTATVQTVTPSPNPSANASNSTAESLGSHDDRLHVKHPIIIGCSIGVILFIICSTLLVYGVVRKTKNDRFKLMLEESIRYRSETNISTIESLASTSRDHLEASTSERPSPFSFDNS